MHPRRGIYIDVAAAELAAWTPVRCGLPTKGANLSPRTLVSTKELEVSMV